MTDLSERKFMEVWKRLFQSHIPYPNRPFSVTAPVHAELTNEQFSSGSLKMRHDMYGLNAEVLITTGHVNNNW